MFRDRTDAGRQLAETLRDRGITADIVLAIPRGGLPVGHVVAERLDVPLDIAAAAKIGAPVNPELAVGAVASDGTVWLNESLLDDLGVTDTYLDAEIERKRQAVRQKVEGYRGDRPPLDLRGEAVLLVDDGIATGATTTACLRQIRNAGADRVVVAVPVAPPDTVERLRAEADAVVSVETPPHFGSVGQWYESFEQVTDERARRYLGSDNGSNNRTDNA